MNVFCGKAKSFFVFVIAKKFVTMQLSTNFSKQ